MPQRSVGYLGDLCLCARSAVVGAPSLVHSPPLSMPSGLAARATQSLPLPQQTTAAVELRLARGGHVRDQNTTFATHTAPWQVVRIYIINLVMEYI